MFSGFGGFKNVIDNINIAQPQPRITRSGSQDLTDTERSPEHLHPRGSASFDLSGVAHSTGHLAESAFSNLRKSLVSQRPFGASTSPTSQESSSSITTTGTRGNSISPQSDREFRSGMRTTLEERLRASFAIGEASNPTTPEPSHSSTPKPQVVEPSNQQLLSPRLVPLPDSRPPTPVEIDHTSPLPPTTDLPKETTGPEIHDPIPEGKPQQEDEQNVDTVASTDTSPLKKGESKIDIIPHTRYPEANVPLPPFSPIPTNLSASQSTQSVHSPVPDETVQPPTSEDSLDSEKLQSQYTDLEKKFSDASTNLEQMRQKQEIIRMVLAELTPVNDLSDVDALREYLQGLNTKQTMSQEEIKRLNGKLRTYDERIEELRDTHRLESRSQSELVDSLRKQLEESEALLKVAHGSTTQAEDEARKRQTELDQTRAEVQKLKATNKDEEEKRVKAISLLKTVRQKLVKAEKEKEDLVKENSSLKEKEKSEREKEKVERERLEREIENIRAEKERDISGLKSHFDKELTGMREKLEKEFMARRGQLELEFSTTKANYQKEITAKNSRIQSLENSVRSLNTERDSLFDQLQLRQAELESSQSLLESLQSTVSEVQFQLREVTDRSALLQEELADAQRELEYRDLKPRVSSEDSERILATLEAKYEAKIGELNARLAEMERDRNDTESAMSRNIQQKTQEIESLRKIVDSSSISKGASEEELAKMKQNIESLMHEISTYKEQLSDLDRQKDRVGELEAQLQRQTAEFEERTKQAEQEVADAKEREAQVRASSKTLREELRKVQASAALLERQRNPGVGYWSSVSRHENNSEAALTSSPTPSTSELASSSTSRVTSPSPASAKNDEEVNLEYLRNVILQFLEHKEMRPHLVRVLSIILHFTPQETRRLIAKV